MLSIQDKISIDHYRKILEAVYLTEENYGSGCSLWSEGLKDGVVTQELYNQAREYYGKLWNYVGG